MITLQEYLDSLGIEYWEEGKNVTEGWIGIECIFCDDTSNHLGINTKNSRYSCWKCGAKGSFTDLITYLENVNFKQAIAVSKNIDFGESGTLLPFATRASSHFPLNSFAGLPKSFTRKFPKKHIQYLIRRDFDPYPLIRKYKLLACHTIGQYRFRIIIPFFLNHSIVTFTSLDVTGKQEPKYLHCPISESVIDPKRMLYNIDSVKQRAVIVEGVTDVWRIGDGAVAVMGTEYVKEQLAMLSDKEIKAAMVIFDSDAIAKGERFANQLSGVIPVVELVELQDGDPDTMTKSQIKQVQRFISKG